ERRLRGGVARRFVGATGDALGALRLGGGFTVTGTGIRRRRHTTLLAALRDGGRALLGAPVRRAAALQTPALDAPGLLCAAGVARRRHLALHGDATLEDLVRGRFARILASAVLETAAERVARMILTPLLAGRRGRLGLLAMLLDAVTRRFFLACVAHRLAH